MSFRSFNPGVEAEQQGPGGDSDGGDEGGGSGDELEGAGDGAGTGVLAPPRRGGEAPRGKRRKTKGPGGGAGGAPKAKKPR